jgi:hypothetical protein
MAVDPYFNQAVRNEHEAIKWAKFGAGQGEKLSEFVLATGFREGKGGLTANEAEAAKYLERSAKQDYIYALLELAKWHANGIHYPIDRTKARSIYERAGSLGSAEGYFQAGLIVGDEAWSIRTEPLNAHQLRLLRKAVELLVKAQRLGSSPAEERLRILRVQFPNIVQEVELSTDVDVWRLPVGLSDREVSYDRHCSTNSKGTGVNFSSPIASRTLVRFGSRTIAGLRTNTVRPAPTAAPFGGSGSSSVGSGFLGLTPPGYELAPRTGLGKGGQRKL